MEQQQSSEFNPKERSAIQAAFQEYDVDGDGHVNAKELVAAMKRVGCNISPECAQRMITAYDGDNSGTLELDEFEDMLNTRKLVCSIRQAFKKLDPEGHGNITKTQLKGAIRECQRLHLTEEQIDGLVEEADINQDGLIDYHEFLELMMPKTD